VVAVDEPLSEQAARVTTAKETRQTSMRYFMAKDYARGMPNVKCEEWPSQLRRPSLFWDRTFRPSGHKNARLADRGIAKCPACY
jgi:hypothetical protein